MLWGSHAVGMTRHSAFSLATRIRRLDQGERIARDVGGDIARRQRKFS